MEDIRMPEDRQDQLAVRKTREGDSQAFNNLVRRYGPLLMRLSLQYLGNQDEAEEQVQEIFLKAFRNLSKYDGRHRFFTWLYSLALNHLRSELRKQRTRAKHIGPGPLRLEKLTAESADPAAELLEKEARDLVRQALGELPVKFREVYLLREVEGLSTLDTAEILSIPEGTVKIRLHRCKRLLKQRLEAYFTE
jgi:RNA polymerase sigma-70 factor (ECF subfamily)